MCILHEFSLWSSRKCLSKHLNTHLFLQVTRKYISPVLYISQSETLAQTTFFCPFPVNFCLFIPAVCSGHWYELNMVKQAQGWSEHPLHQQRLWCHGIRAMTRASQHICNLQDFWTPRRLLKLGPLASLELTSYATGLGGIPHFSAYMLCLRGGLPSVSTLQIPFTYRTQSF